VTFKWQNEPWLDALTPQLAVNILFNQFVTSTDNADRTHTWLAEITEGRTLELKTDQIPA